MVDMMTISNVNKISSDDLTVPVFSSVDFFVNYAFFKDQYEMQELLEKIEDNAIKIILDNNSVIIRGQWDDVDKATKQLENLKRETFSETETQANGEVKDNEELPKKESTEKASHPLESSHPPEVEKKKRKERQLVRDLTPSVPVNQSLSQNIEIDDHIWHYLLFQKANKVAEICSRNGCSTSVTCKSSKGKITYNLEVRPQLDEKSQSAEKHMNEAVEEFAELYKTASSEEIAEEKFMLPVESNEKALKNLADDLRSMGFLLLPSTMHRLIGPRQDIKRAKDKVWNFSDELHSCSSEENSAVRSKQMEKGKKQEDKSEPLKFKTLGGIDVCVAKGDLVRQSVDAIVNPANSWLRHGGGAARAIASAAGFRLNNECQDHIRKHGELRTSQVMHTSAGNLQPTIKFVIHAVGPRDSDFSNKQALFHSLRDTFLNCLFYANDYLKIHSVAIPAISSGIFHVSLDLVAQASFDALLEFDRVSSSRPRALQRIYFLNKDEPTFSFLRTSFETFIRKDLGTSVDPDHRPHNNGRSSPPVISKQPAGLSRRDVDTSSDDSFEKLEESEASGMPQNASDGPNGKTKGEDNEEDEICIICMDKITDMKMLNCKHKFCRGCIDECFTKHQPKCPSCGKVFGILKGNQPHGTMTKQINSWQHLAGYPKCGTIEINYSFQGGEQGENHPNPGQRYRGTHRTAYLPDNTEGNEVYQLLKRAFDAGLVFTIGTSNTTGQENVVIWNDVHHKTSTNGQYGYPDPTYLKRVREELAAKGIE